jgi:predicted ArsR family transcriptional regulator
MAYEEISELPEEWQPYLYSLSETALVALYAERHTSLTQEDVAEELGVSQQNVSRAANTARRRLESLVRPPDVHVQRSLPPGGYTYPGRAWELPEGSTEKRLTAGGEPPRFESNDKRS